MTVEAAVAPTANVLGIEVTNPLDGLKAWFNLYAAFWLGTLLIVLGLLLVFHKQIFRGAASAASVAVPTGKVAKVAGAVSEVA